MVKKISETLGVDAGTVKFSEEQFVHLSSAREQRMAEIEDLQSALEAYKLQEKGEEMFMSKIGPGVSAADKDRILEVFRNVNDENLASSNVNSLGYKLNVIIIEPFWIALLKLRLAAWLDLISLHKLHNPIAFILAFT